MQHTLLWMLLICGNTVHGMEQDAPHIHQATNSKRKSEQNSKVHGCKKYKVAPSETVQFSDLPDDIHHNILSFLSSDIQSWKMWDKDLATHKCALAAWCTFSSLSKNCRRNAHHWAQQHFQLSESDYILFKQAQKMRTIAIKIMESALKAGELSHINYAELSAWRRPFNCQFLTKKGLLLAIHPSSYPHQLYTPWGRLDLFVSMQSNREDGAALIDTLLYQRFLKQLTMTFYGMYEALEEEGGTQYYCTRLDEWLAKGRSALRQSPDKVLLTPKLVAACKGKEVVIYPVRQDNHPAWNSSIFALHAINSEPIEPMVRYGKDERYVRTRAATKIIWNIFSGPHAKEYFEMSHKKESVVRTNS